MTAGTGDTFREYEFVRFLSRLMSSRGMGAVQEERLGDGLRADLAVHTPEHYTVVEAKHSAPQTRARLEDFAAQIERYVDTARRNTPRGMPVRGVLAVPGTLSATATKFLSDRGIGLWDGPWIAHQAAKVNMTDEAARFVGTGAFEAASRSDALSFAEQLRFSQR